MIQLRVFLGCCSNMDVARLQGNGQNKKIFSFEIYFAQML